MILIYPPVARPSEPPAGIAHLSGALNRHGVSHTVLDANIEGILHLLQTPRHASYYSSDRWTIRAFRKRSENLLSLKKWDTYAHFDSYKRTVLEVNRALRSSSGSNDIAIGLANYEDRGLSPLKSRDLIRAAEDPGRNPFYPYFEKRLTALMEEKRPSVVGFSLNYLSQALCAFAMAGFIRKNFPGVKIVLGGGLVNSWMRGPHWKNPFGGLVDRLVAGPGEHQLLSMAGIHDVKEDFTPDYSSLQTNDYLSPGFIHSIYAFDPNGIPIEFSHNIKGKDVRKTPKMIDKLPSAITKESVEPQTDKWPKVKKPTLLNERKVYPGAGSELFHGIKK